MQKKTWLILPVVICLSHWLSCSKKEFEVRFLPGPPKFFQSQRRPQNRGASNRQKNGHVKKRMASWARQRQQITEAADGGARARTAADGAVVLNLRRGPGAYALLSRADGQLTRAGQHYYSHLGLRPPSKDFDYNQPLIREGPNDYILLCNGRKKLVRSLQGGEHRLTKLGKGFFRDKYFECLVHAPVIIRGSAQRAERRGGPAAPILQLSDETYFRIPLGGQHPEHAVQDRGGDAPAPVHEGPA